MKINSILDDPDIRQSADELKKIILEHGNEYPWEDLSTKHGYDLDILGKVVSVMLDVGELYEPVIGYLGVIA